MNEEISKLRSELQEVTEKFTKRVNQITSALLCPESALLEEARKRFPLGSKYHFINKDGCTNEIREINNEEFVFVKKWLTGPTVDAISNGGKVVWRSDLGWAEIIPEEKPKSYPRFMVQMFEEETKSFLNNVPEHKHLEKKIEAEFIENIKTFTDKSMFPDISLHAQIREGGWEFIFKNVKLVDFTSIQNGYPTNTENFLINKLASYNRLLALEKVLNGGKKRKSQRFIVNLVEDTLHIESCLYIRRAVEFYEKQDAIFAIDFAEKEFKLFYNHK